MMFEGVNYLAIAAAAIAGFIFGAVWYSSLAKQWMAAANLTLEDVSQPAGLAGAAPYAIAFAGQLVMALFLAGLLAHFGPAQMTLKGGLLTAGSVWLGFIVPAMVVNHTFQGAKRTLTLIDSGHWLGVLLLQSIIIVSLS